MERLVERKGPGEVQVYCAFRKHLGGRFSAAGLGVIFHWNQGVGIQFKVDVQDYYREAVVRGVEEGIAERFPGFLSEGSVWVMRVDVDDVASSWDAFYRVGRMVVEQVWFLRVLDGRSV